MESFSALRVLFFAHETTWSGAPIQLLHLVTWLQRHGWQVAVVVPNPATPESGPISDQLRENGLEIFPLLDLAVEPDLAALRSLCKKFDAVVANTLVMSAAVRAAHEAGIAAIWYIHESLVARQLMAQHAEIQPTFALADLLVMPTRRTSQIYLSFTDRPIEVVPYGIPAAVASKATKRDDPALCTFLLLGCYELRKGQDILLEAIAGMPATVRERAIFRMAGRKLDRKFYEALARTAAALPEVELLDALDHDEACAALAAADVLVCASRDETMPIAILEAMSLGKAVVSTEVGGISEWLCDRQNALLVPTDDSPALMQAMRRCIEESRLLESLGRNAQATFRENFSVDRLGERFSALIERALSMKIR
ncbi:MAG: glycosyltransferase family 4 protein [Chthoniobacterales bacterium]